MVVLYLTGYSMIAALGVEASALIDCRTLGTQFPRLRLLVPRSDPASMLRKADRVGLDPARVGDRVEALCHGHPGTQHIHDCQVTTSRISTVRRANVRVAQAWLPSVE